MRGCPTCRVYTWGFVYAEESEAVLRARSSPLHDVQLLPAASAVGNHSCAEPVRSNIGKDSGAVRVPVGRVCGDARPRASSDERAAKGYAFRGAEGAEATS